MSLTAFSSYRWMYIVVRAAKFNASVQRFSQEIVAGFEPTIFC